MNPQPFHESNQRLTAPKGMEDNCGTLEVFTNGEVCISCWKPTAEERERIADGLPIWLHVVSGHTQPPVALTVENPFMEGPASG